MFLVVSLVVLAVMVGYYAYEYIYRKNRSMIFSAAMALIVSGAVGNIIDRLISHRPGVVDFISIGIDGVYRWPTFNVADSCIVAGAALLIIVFYREEKRHREAKDSE
jgi:signal peptidase II